MGAFLEAVAGRRIVAFHPKESARYLRRLLASAGVASVPPLENYEVASSDLGMNPVAHSYVLRLVEQRCLHFGVPLAAQLASGHLHLTAWQPNGPVRGELRYGGGLTVTRGAVGLRDACFGCRRRTTTSNATLAPPPTCVRPRG